MRKALCMLYINGFCPLGPGCPNGQYSLLCFINPGFSPKYELPDMDKMDLPAPRPHNDRPPGYLGSAAAAANAASGGHHGGRSGGGGGNFMGGGSMGTVGGMERGSGGGGGGKSTGEYRPLSEVVCFKVINSMTHGGLNDKKVWAKRTLRQQMSQLNLSFI